MGFLGLINIVETDRIYDDTDTVIKYTGRMTQNTFRILHQWRRSALKM